MSQSQMQHRAEVIKRLLGPSSGLNSLPTSEYLVVQDLVQEAQDDWLFQGCSPDGKRRLLAERLLELA